MKTKKKVFSENWSVLTPKLGEDRTQKKIFLQFEGFIRAGWLFFVWSSSAQISMGGRYLAVKQIR